jgi:hypothetical protein
MLSQGVKPETALTQLGLSRYCCRMWMQNPFKVPVRTDRQNGPGDTGLDQQATTLSMATSQPTPMAPLQAMANPKTIPRGTAPLPLTQPARPTTAYTVAPMGEIGLPVIPEVPLPEIPTMTEGNKNENKPVHRVYQAW